MTNSQLPIASFREQIVDTVGKHNVTIIVAETGAGKSTQVPQYLLAEGHQLVVSQPRIVAARKVAARVAEEMDTKFGGLVGYRTSRERNDSAETRCLFCTDGLALVRELVGQNKGILILDEVHEWNENMEVLGAWIKEQHDMGNIFKVVLMSATIEAEPLSEFFGGAPIIEVPGRLFPVTEQEPQGTLEDDVARLVREGRNVLVFQPGKAEIANTINILEDMGVRAQILPLHGALTDEEQDKCFAAYRLPKVVVSTNVAQTSVTIPDIDAVVDSGLEKRIEVSDGVEGLYTRAISLADSKQRKGRAGRVKPGVYIDHCPESDRPDFPVAEILRRLLDETYLRLAIAGFKMEKLSFFHQPSIVDISDARRSLIRLGCMTSDGKVTKAGRLVNRWPVSVKFGMMLIEANKRGVLDDMLTVAAIMEVGGIVVPPASRNNPHRPDWRSMLHGSEHTSDVLGQLKVWDMAEGMSNAKMKKSGIGIRDYYRARDIRKLLVRSVGRTFPISTTGDREDILKSVCAGMVDYVYENRGGYFETTSGDARELGNSSVVRNARWLVGKPFDLEIDGRYGKRVLEFIELASKIEPEWLAEVAPHLVQSKKGRNPRYDQKQGCVVSTTSLTFNGHPLTEIVEPDPNHPEAARIFATWLASLSRSKVESQGATVLVRNLDRAAAVRQLNLRAGKEVIPNPSLADWYEQQLDGARSLNEMARMGVVKNLEFPEPDATLVRQIEQGAPLEIDLIGRRFSVTYTAGVAPQVKITYQDTSATGWSRLPDSGVLLPDGRTVEVGIRMSTFGYWMKNTDIPALKSEVETFVNHALWDKYRYTPTRGVVMTPPDSHDPTSDIPLVEVTYGTSVRTGSPLVKFGTYAGRALSNGDARWTQQWFDDKSAATALQEKSRTVLAEARETLNRRTRIEAKQFKVEALKRQIRQLTDHNNWPNFVLLDDRQLLRSLLDEFVSADEGQLDDWLDRATAHHAKVVLALDPPPQALTGKRLETGIEALRAQFGK